MSTRSYNPHSNPAANNGASSSAAAPPPLPTHTNFTETTCYYLVLGLDKTNRPSQDDIKKAYKRLALRYHPDKNAHETDEAIKAQAERMFKLVSRAYEVLSSDKLRTVYDRHGHRGIERLNGNDDGDDHDADGGFGGGAHPFGGFGGGFGSGEDPFAGFMGGGGGGFGGPHHARFGRRSSSNNGPHSHHHHNMFTFHDPFEIFREVFGMAGMGGMGGSPHSHQPPCHRHEETARQARNADINNDTFGNSRDTGGHHHNHSNHHHDHHNRAHARQHQNSHQRGMGGGMMMEDPFGGFGMGGMGMMGSMFGGGMGGMMAHHHNMMSQMNQMMMGMNGMGGGAGQSYSFSSSTSGGGGNRIVSSSTSSTTQIVNGQRVTRTVRRQTDANGHTTEDVSEHAEPMGIGYSSAQQQQQGFGGGSYLGW